MKIIKGLGLIFLAFFLILNGLINFMGIEMYLISFITGLFAAVSGVLILLSIREFYHWPEG